MDALIEVAPHLIPEWMKQNKEGEVLFNYCWDVVFDDAVGGLYVQCFCWRDGEWRRRYDWLLSDWDRQNPALELAS